MMTRTGGRRFPILVAVITAMAMLFSPVQAQEGSAPGGPGKRANVSEGGTDLPVDTSTTGEVDVGGAVTGDIDTAGDGDWFKMELEAGTRYQIDLEGKDTGRGDIGSPLIQLLYDADGNSITGTRDPNSGVGFNSRLIYTPSASAAYFVWVAADGSQEPATGTYTLSVIVLGANGVSEADTDIRNNTNTSGRIDVGASVTGSIGSNDTDWFRVDLEAGKTYQIDMEGRDTGRGTYTDPYLTIFDVTGVFSRKENDDGGENKNARLTYTPATSDRYFISATRGVAGLSDTGTYTLSVRDITPASADASLKSLSLSDSLGDDIELSATFSTETTSYTASVESTVASTTVTAETTDEDATAVIMINDVEDADGTVDLVAGYNVITVEVTAQDGTTTQTYTVTVLRAQPDDDDDSTDDTITSLLSRLDAGLTRYMDGGTLESDCGIPLGRQFWRRDSPGRPESRGIQLPGRVRPLVHG